MNAMARVAQFDDEIEGLSRLFRDRDDAGTHLGAALAKYRWTQPIVLGLARGGVPVAAAVARELGAELDVVVVRKLGSPMSDELAIGAVTADGGIYFNMQVIRELGVSRAYIDSVVRTRMAEGKQLAARLRDGTSPVSLEGRTVILTDDGLATGATMIAAVRAVRAHHPARVVVAVPVGSQEACAALEAEADALVCLAMPHPFWAVGLYYRDFRQTEDSEVVELLREARALRTVQDVGQRGV